MIQFRWKRYVYYVHQLSGAAEVLEAVDLLYEGWKVLCDKRGARADIAWDEYLQKAMAVVCGPYWGAVLVFYNKHKAPLGYMLLAEDTETKQRRTLFVYAGYSKGRDPNTGKMAMDFVCQWARLNGYAEVRAQSRRTNGAAMRYFRKVLGFTVLSVVFKKDV